MEELYEDMRRKGLVSQSSDWIIRAIGQHKLITLELANTGLLQPYDQIDRILIRNDRILAN